MDERCKKHISVFPFYVEHNEPLTRSRARLRYWGPQNTQQVGNFALELTGGGFRFEDDDKIYTREVWVGNDLNDLISKAEKFTLLMPFERTNVTYTARLVRNLGAPHEETILTDIFTITPMPHILIPD